MKRTSLKSTAAALISAALLASCTPESPPLDPPVFTSEPTSAPETTSADTQSPEEKKDIQTTAGTQASVTETEDPVTSGTSDTPETTLTSGTPETTTTSEPVTTAEMPAETPAQTQGVTSAVPTTAVTFSSTEETAAEVTAAAASSAAPVTTDPEPSETPAQTPTVTSVTSAEKPAYVATEEETAEDTTVSEPIVTPHAATSAAITATTPASGSAGRNSRLASHKLGSAEELRGKTVVVSIYAEDNYTKWDLDNNEDDLALFRRTRDYLRIAADWIAKSGRDYGVNDISFIWDWEKDEDLFFWAYFDTDFPAAIDAGTSEIYAWEFISSFINSEALLEKYDADNIIYMMFFNTPFGNPAPACTRNYYEGMEEPYEICYMFMRDNEIEQSPGVLAHEMLHTYGAPDLYGEDWQFGITEEYAEYADRLRINDIMRFVGDPVTYEMPYDRIVNEITEITAYYIGWTDRSQTVDSWQFGRSEHE